MSATKPTWDAEVSLLFSLPYWIDESNRGRVGNGWIGCMGGKQTPEEPGYLINLDKIDSVKEWSVTIYNHLASRNMPLTTDETQYWPADALETFRLWVNQGYRENDSSPFDENERIPPPAQMPNDLRVRPDIRSLSDDEINVFRARLDDVMHIGNPDASSPWQQFAYIHTNWCLHYQEAFAFWHRAYLLYLEALIDHPIPYWDWMAKDASIDGSPSAGLPKAFLDETYVHPETGETRPNPLRYAAAKDGKSKLCVVGKMSGAECQYVQRNPVFYTSGDDHREEREKLFEMSRIFQQQVVDALAFKHFSEPQGHGFPWANIPAFDPPQKDSLYPNRTLNFDGLYEQPHDNYHGWIGGDMADNAFTAFDPIFLSYHANIDRMLEVWIRAHPLEQYTTQVALQPFIGPKAQEINYTSAQKWRYSSIGELAQDSRRIGYDYAKPVSEQFIGKSHAKNEATGKASDGTAASCPVSTAASTLNNDLTGPWVVFDGVRCTHDSYFIDVFLNQPDASVDDARADNQHYVGRFSRIGMGLVDDKDRCIKQGVTRVLNAAGAFSKLGLDHTDQPDVSIVVTHLDTDHVLDVDEYEQLPGFVPQLIAGNQEFHSQLVRPNENASGGCCG